MTLGLPKVVAEKTSAGAPAMASWHGLGSALAVELIAGAGWDLAMLDQQHGFGGQAELLAGLMAARAGGVPAVVRVGWNDPALISRALDAGASGIMCPMVNSAADAAQLVAAAKYPPLGARSWGPYRAAQGNSATYLERANREILTFAQIETADALAAVDDIVGTNGLDGVCVGPNDLALSLTGERDITAPTVRDAVGHIHARARVAGCLTWIFCNDTSYAETVRPLGWDIMTIGTDSGWLMAGAPNQ